MLRRLVLLSLVVITLAGCGLFNPGPEKVAEQVVTALDQQDVATLNTLLDNKMPYKDIELLTELRYWEEREHVSEDWGKSLGPFERMDVQPAREAGASTIVKVLLHHRDGEASIDLTMHSTSDGWRVLAWETDIIEKRRPTS